MHTAARKIALTNALLWKNARLIPARSSFSILCSQIRAAATRGMAGAGAGLLLSPKISGNKRRAFGLSLLMIGAITTGIFGFIYFAMVNTASEPIIFFAIILSLIPHDMMYGPQAALIAESFTGRLRYSGASLGYQLASVIAGGPAPLIATWLFGTYHSSTAIAGYIAICAVITLVATALMTDYTGKDIDAASTYERT